MRGQSVLSQKKRGPPATGKGELIGVRVQPDLMKDLDEWRSSQDDSPSRPEAIRRLLQTAFGGTPRSGGRGSKGTSHKASEMAGSTIDHLGDKSASASEQAKRKRRLVKGPSEFRDMRDDLPKRKR
jgi:hypothetical protein